MSVRVFVVDICCKEAFTPTTQCATQYHIELLPWTLLGKEYPRRDNPVQAPLVCLIMSAPILNLHSVHNRKSPVAAHPPRVKTCISPHPKDPADADLQSPKHNRGQRGKALQSIHNRLRSETGACSRRSQHMSPNSGNAQARRGRGALGT
jgi:hypothetical protein